MHYPIDEFEVNHYGELDYYGPKPRTDLEAVRISIAKWTVLTQQDGPIAEGGIETCGCCLLHHTHRGGDGCRMCPVVTIGGAGIGCQGTSYDIYDTVEEDDDERMQAARNEVAFLKQIELKLASDLGIRLHAWHDGQASSLYAVGSCFVAGVVEVPQHHLRRAIAELRRETGTTEDQRRQLHALITELELMRTNEED